MFLSLFRKHHKYTAPPGPKLQSLKEAITSKLNPICFYVKNDPNYSTYVHDEHFYVKLKGRVHLNCQPPSRYNKLKRHIRLRWNLER
uniref:Uncharacterized protein n=1 Tax=Theileria annulata TaxID=5874 RepID=A0A3B0MTB2_THEAN